MSHKNGSKVLLDLVLDFFNGLDAFLIDNFALIFVLTGLLPSICLVIFHTS